MYTEVSKTTPTISETTKIAGGSSAVESSMTSSKFVENNFFLNNVAQHYTTRIATQTTTLTTTMKPNMYTNVTNTTATISETRRTAGGTSTVESLRRLANLLKTLFFLNNAT